MGQWVEFTTTQQVDHEFLSVVLGEQRAADASGLRGSPLSRRRTIAPLSDAVQTIKAISCRYEMQGRAMYQLLVPRAWSYKARRRGGNPSMRMFASWAT